MTFSSLPAFSDPVNPHPPGKGWVGKTVAAAMDENVNI